jgi:CBS domain-containing protein
MAMELSDLSAYISLPMSTLGEIMRTEFVTVAPEDTIGEAAQKMVDAGRGAAIVSDFGRLIGILTERDLLKAVAARTHSSEARVREWRTADPITADRSMTADEAAKVMLDNGFRHLPVVEGERAIGIVSMRVVLRATTQE